MSRNPGKKRWRRIVAYYDEYSLDGRFVASHQRTMKDCTREQAIYVAKCIGKWKHWTLINVFIIQ